MREHSSILIYGHDVTLLDTRRWVLERAGYRVSTAMEDLSVKAAMEKDGVDLLLLCHTLSAEEKRVVFASTVRLHPKVKRLSFVTLSDDGWREGVDGAKVESFAGAVGLVSAVRKLLHQNSNE